MFPKQFTLTLLLALLCAGIDVSEAAAVAACDPIDGVTDGVINDPRKCTYDPAASVCPAGRANTCLTVKEADAVRMIWDGPRSTQTRQRLWSGPEQDSVLGVLAGPAPFPIGVDYLRYWVKQDPNFDWKTLSKADFEKYFRLSQDKFNLMIGTDDADLRHRNRSMKVLMWHGEADPLIPPRGSVNYYLRVVAANGGQSKVDKFMRLFLAPGVSHCGSGDGPAPEGLLDTVVDWVEKGKLPDRILASKTLPDGTKRTRPLCPFPQTAQWDGKGDTDDADSFTCMDGQHDLADFAAEDEEF